MNTNTRRQMAASMLLIASLAMGGVSEAQTMSPQKIFRITMAAAAKTQESPAPVNGKASQAAEQLAIANKDTEAAAGALPRFDADGYYFSYAQTASYEHKKANERMGSRSPRAYEQQRCRRAASVEPSGEMATGNVTWRVCPDAQGHYRVTL